MVTIRQRQTHLTKGALCTRKKLLFDQPGLNILPALQTNQQHPIWQIRHIENGSFRFDTNTFQQLSLQVKNLYFIKPDIFATDSSGPT